MAYTLEVRSNSTVPLSRLGCLLKRLVLVFLLLFHGCFSFLILSGLLLFKLLINFKGFFQKSIFDIFDCDSHTVTEIEVEILSTLKIELLYFFFILLFYCKLY